MSNGKGPSDAIDPRLVRKLADILRDTELTEIEVEQGGLKIRVAREIIHAPPAQVYATAAAPLAHSTQPHIPPQGPAGAAAPSPAPDSKPTGEVVKSPMVGTVFLQPQPGAEPFAGPGSRVKQGQTLLIIEAMKTMNPIPAPRDGVVLELLVGDSQPVEFGEPLIVLE